MSVVALGESLGLLVASRLGRLELAPSMDLGFGGAESNVAIGVARLGAPSTWMGRLGDDALGRLVERQLRAEGVETSITRDPVAPTALMLKERPTAGSSTCTPRPRSVATLACVAGCSHISVCMAGASSTGQRAVSRTFVSRSSARPEKSRCEGSLAAPAGTTSRKAGASRYRPPGCRTATPSSHRLARTL